MAFTVGELKDLTCHRSYGVKLPELQAVWAGLWVDPPSFKTDTFFYVLGQFIKISNQMEANGHVLNFENTYIYYIIGYYIKFLFKVWDVAIYLHLIGNFYKLAH